MCNWSKLGIKPSEILLPSESVDSFAYSVVACDQFTSEPHYWQEAEKITKGKPSTLKLTFPEIYLSEEPQERISTINNTMKQYLEQGVFTAVKDAMIYVERKLKNGKIRKGLVLAVDLEKYDYSKGSQSLIRATEGTIIDRLPPRVRIRENALLELPHIMLLIDDINKTVIEPLSNQALSLCYSTQLMLEGGSINGYLVKEKQQEQIANALSLLADKEAFCSKYGVGEEKGVLLYAVGDGNHSLATAKVCWEKLKASLTKDQQEEHPARYALCEMVNVHDEALEFEPIHRVLFNVNNAHILSQMRERFGFGLLEGMAHQQIIDYITSDGEGEICVACPQHNLTVGTLQQFLDEYLLENPKVNIDYVHSEKVVRSLGAQAGNMGFILPSMKKQELFKTVIMDGVLPRKTFSMGEGQDKRYYFEARKIR